MSDIILNGNIYNGVTSVKLMKSDRTGYAEFFAEAPTDKLAIIIERGNLGDLTFGNAEASYSFLEGRNGGTISFPNAITISGRMQSGSFANLLFPAATVFTSATGTNAGVSVFQKVTVSGTLDLSAVEGYGNMSPNQTFMNASIGTLKLGTGFKPHNGMFSNMTCTNLLWNANSAQVTSSSMIDKLQNATAITNLYVPTDFVNDVLTAISGGTLTKVTNVYDLTDWEEA